MGGLAVGNPPTTKPSTNALAGESPIIGNLKKQEFCQNCSDKDKVKPRAKFIFTNISCS